MKLGSGLGGSAGMGEAVHMGGAVSCASETWLFGRANSPEEGQMSLSLIKLVVGLLGRSRGFQQGAGHGAPVKFMVNPHPKQFCCGLISLWWFGRRVWCGILGAESRGKMPFLANCS